MTSLRKELAARAVQAQNHPANWNVDITTFVHLAETDEQAARHVEYYETRVASSEGR